MENLGKTSAWQIRDFPEALREAVVDAAKANGATVPEFVTRIVIAARDAGWFENGLTNPSTNLPAIVRRPDSTELRELTTLARDATPPGKDSVALQLARRAIAARLKVFAG